MARGATCWIRSGLTHPGVFADGSLCAVLTLFTWSEYHIQYRTACHACSTWTLRIFHELMLWESSQGLQCLSVQDSQQHQNQKLEYSSLGTAVFFAAPHC